MKLKPVLGPFALFFYAAGVIVGAGVYSVIGAAAGIAESGLWLSFVAAAVVALLTGLSYAEMATAFPVAGAEFVYMRRAFPKADWAAFAVGTTIVIGGSATAATVAVAFGGYLSEFIGVPVPLAAIAVIALSSGLAIVGIRESSSANILFTVVEIAGLVLVIAAGFSFEPPLNEAVPTDLHAGSVLSAAAILFFVYLGFEELANVAEEARNPGRDIPRAILLALGATAVLYVLVALAVLRLASPEALAGDPAPLSVAVETRWPNAVAWLNAIALFATANTVLITVIATARLAFAMGRDGQLPAIFGRVLPRRGTPWVASLLILLLAAALAPIGELAVLAGFSSFTALLAFLAVNVTVIVLRFRQPDRERPFRLPLAVRGLPLIPVIAIAATLVLLAFFEAEVYQGGAIALAIGAAAYLLRRATQRRQPKRHPSVSQPPG